MYIVHQRFETPMQKTKKETIPFKILIMLIINNKSKISLLCRKVKFVGKDPITKLRTKHNFNQEVCE